MSGNKKNNGVHEVGTKDIAAAYKGDTPGQTVDEYLKLSAAKNVEKKKERSKNFSQVFDNPLKGFPYNEDFTVRDVNEEVEAFMEGMDFWRVTVTKDINKLKKGRSVVVKARNSSEALKKGAKNMGDPKAAVLPGYMNAVKDKKESVEESMKIKDIFKKHKRELTKAYKTGDLSFSGSAGKKAEDDLTTWAMDNNEIKTDNPDEFFDWLSRDLEDIVKGKIKEDVSENFKPYADKVYSRCVDFYIQFRGGKGDRVTSEENKKDFETAKKMVDAYCRTNKIKQKPVYSTPQEGSSAYKVGLMIDKSYSKTSDYDDGVDLQPLYVSLSKLKTAEDHGGGWDKATPSDSRRLKGAVIGEDEAVEGKIKYRGNLKGLREETISEEKIVYQVKGIQKPESDAFTSAAKLMKLKVKFTKGSGGVTLVQLDGTKSNLRKLDGVVRGKSTYGDPSTSGQGSHFDESFVMESAIEHGIFLEEGVMSDMLVDIQDGISAKDLAKEYKIPLSMAKSFLKDYYSQKPKRRNESVEGENMDIIEEEVLTEGKNLIPAFQEIVNTKGAKKIGGIMVDMFTASVITQAYEKVNDKNKANMENSDVKKLVGLAQRIMGMKEGSEYKAVSNPTDATTLKGADGKKLYDTAVGKGIKEESQNLTEKPSMSGSKLTGQEISVYFRKNKVTDQFEKLAVKIALDHDGAMSFAIKKIEKLKKGLSKAKSVKKALDYANYGENTLPKIGFTFKESVDRNKAKSPVGKYKKPKLNMGEEEILEKVVKSTLKISSKVYPDLKKLEKAETINDKEVGAIIAQLKKGIEVESDDGEPAIISRKGSDTWDKVWGRMDTFVRDEIYYIMKKHDSDAMQAILSPYMG